MWTLFGLVWCMSSQVESKAVYATLFEPTVHGCTALYALYEFAFQYLFSVCNRVCSYEFRSDKR